MGGFLAGAPESASLAGIGNVSTQLKWLTTTGLPQVAAVARRMHLSICAWQKGWDPSWECSAAAFVCDLVPLSLDDDTAPMLLRWRPAQNMATEFLGLISTDDEAITYYLSSV